MRYLVTAMLALVTALPALAGERVPGDTWSRFAEPSEAGFDATKLEAAREVWEALPSSAFVVVADGAVVAAWGEVERRFMCHSVRKSFLSALYGIYWDLETERRARILDLLKARSGVFHPAAYAGRTDSQPRGSQGPGRYFAYNNWDFNTLAAILEQETGADVFEAFDEHFGQPLGMEDWRVSDGYYHYERDKSRYPAYPFRMSARDAARFGLLFARDGVWGDTQILSRHWVRRSTALYSIDDEVMGYGFMWWVALEPRFAPYGFACALGVGNQMIAVLPDLDLVIVNRANTYEREGTPMGRLLDLIEQVLEARTGEMTPHPRLVPLEMSPQDPRMAEATHERLAEYVGEWPVPPEPLGLPQRTTVEITREDGHLVASTPYSGTFVQYLQPNGWLLESDSLRRYRPIRDDEGRFAGLADVDTIVLSALRRAPDNADEAGARLSLAGDQGGVKVQVVEALLPVVEGDAKRAEASARELASQGDPERVEREVNGVGYAFLRFDHPELAREVFSLNTRLFPEAYNTWDSLGEAHMKLGNHDEAIRCFEKTLELNPDNNSARQMLARIRAGSEKK